MLDTNHSYWKFNSNWVNPSGNHGSADFDPMLYVITNEDDFGKILGGAYFLLVQTENSDKSRSDATNSDVTPWSSADNDELLILRESYKDLFCIWLYTEKGYFEPDS